MRAAINARTSFEGQATARPDSQICTGEENAPDFTQAHRVERDTPRVCVTFFSRQNSTSAPLTAGTTFGTILITPQGTRLRRANEKRPRPDRLGTWPINEKPATNFSAGFFSVRVYSTVTYR